MRKSSTAVLIASDRIQQMVHIVRGQRVMLDFDLAQLYGVPTMRINEQVRRNRERFPEDFAYQRTQQEVTNLISQNAISKFRARRTSKTPLGVHRTRRRHAVERAPFADSGAGQYRDHADIRPAPAAHGHAG